MTRDERRLRSIRDEFPVTGHQVYLNTGTCGPLPRRSADAIRASVESDLAYGRIRPQRFADAGELLADARRALAHALGAREDQIALTNRTTDGLNLILWGLRWQPGDQILTTRHEHPGLLVPLAALSRRYGVEVRYVPLGGPPETFTPEAVVTAFRRAMSDRTRLLAVSHVLWTNGAVLPIRELARIAHDRGARVLIDGAQSAGAIPLDLTATGVDFYAFPGQKWLCAPEGTGGLYVSDDGLAAVEPTFTGYASAKACDHSAPYFLPAHGALRFEIGMPFPAAIAGLRTSVRWLAETVGIPWATRRVARLATTLAAGLREIDGVRVLTPDPAPRLGPSGLVTFAIDGVADDQAVATLEERGYQTRSIPAPYGGVRVSTAFCVTEEELSEFVQAVEAIVQRR